MNPKKVKKVILGILSPHWYRTIRLELIRTQTKKFKQTILRKKYWIEGTMDIRGKSSFGVYTKGTLKNSSVDVGGPFSTLNQAEKHAFKLADVELKTIATIKNIKK